MKARRGRISKWLYLAAITILAFLSVSWLEWLGSERPLNTIELPVTHPASTNKTGLFVETYYN